jgi:outer membrane protein assembly factor BamB
MRGSAIVLTLLLALACSFCAPAPEAAPADKAPAPAADSSGAAPAATSARATSTSATSPSASNGHDWPQWRGPARDAISPQTGLLRAWPESGPQIVWRAPVGAGFSSVSVAGGSLYTLWDEGGKQFLVSLDAATGKEIWRRHLGAAFTNHYGDGPRSTPLVDGPLVFAVGTDGLLLAADRKTGEPKWQHDLVKDYGSALPSYGLSSSPLVVDGKLIIEAGAEGASFIAFDKGSGKVAWKAGGDNPAYSSPIEITIDGVTQIVFWSAHGLHAVSADEGTVLWDYPWETFCPVTGDPLNTATPIYMPPDRIFLSSGSGAAAIRIARADAIFAVETLWESEQMRSDVNTSLLLGDHIYGFDRGTLKSLDATTGEVKWKARGFGRGSLIAADGTLIVLGEAGNLALVDATPDAYTERATAQILASKNWTAPSLAGGKLYLRNHEEIVCIDLRSTT